MEKRRHRSDEWWEQKEEVGAMRKRSGSEEGAMVVCGGVGGGGLDTGMGAAVCVLLSLRDESATIRRENGSVGRTWGISALLK